MALVLLLGLGVVLVLIMKVRHEIAYVNGAPVSIVTEDIGGDARLRQDAARAFIRMRDAAAAEGFTLTPSGPLSGFRTTEEQLSLRMKLGAYGDGAGGLAAAPGKSPHQSGIALDLSGLDARKSNFDRGMAQWLSVHGPEYGWFPVGASYVTTPEPWHWEWRSFPSSSERVS